MVSEFSEKGKAAVELAEVLRWPILPIWWIEDGRCACGNGDCSAGKHPLGKLVPNGLADASSDPDVIRQWWKAYPEANLATRTGDVAWVLDLDGLEGIRAFSQWADGHPDLPEVPTARTGGGGRHLFYVQNPDVRNGAKLSGAPVDVRGVNGYVILPPSNHQTGGCYRWELPPTKYELQPAPGWLLDLVTKGNGSVRLTMEGDLQTHPGAPEGKRNHTLCRLVGAYLAANGVTNDLLPLAVAWGSRCQPPLEEKQVRRTVFSLAEKHAQQQPTKPKGAVILQPYAEIAAETVRWLWPARIPLGKLVIVSGDPGLGKSYLLLDVAARVSTGRDFADDAASDQGEVIVVTSEDGAADTVRPRLDLLGADVGKVFHLEGVRHDDGKVYPLLLDRHVDILDELLGERPGVKLLILDPISGMMGEVDTHRNAEVRACLGPVAKLAEKHGVAIVGINHHTKSQGKAIYRSLGSLAFVAAARAAWAVVADPDDDARRLFLPVKNNLAQTTGLAFRLVDGKVEWEASPVLISVDDLDADSDCPRDEAKRWLESALLGGPAEAKSLLKRAKADGISERTLRRAKKELRVESTRLSDEWVWSLPPAKEKADESFTF
jgi:hypothetical protein